MLPAGVEGRLQRAQRAFAGRLPPAALRKADIRRGQLQVAALAATRDEAEVTLVQALDAQALVHAQIDIPLRTDVTEQGQMIETTGLDLLHRQCRVAVLKACRQVRRLRGVLGQ